MVCDRADRVAGRTVVGVVASIAVVDVVANVLLPDEAKLPLKLAIVVAYLAWVRRAAGMSWRELGLGRSEVGPGIRWGIAALAVVASAVVFLALVSQSSFEESSAAHDSTTIRVLEPLVVIPLGTVVFEEVIFRGVLLAALMRVVRPGNAIGIAALVFGLWHLPPALGDASGDGFWGGLGIVAGTVGFTTFAGVLFGWLRLRSGSLLAPALAHVASNSIAYVAAVVVLQ